jgi:DNA invertase Pin-like site-specific DNA recombinase
MKGKTIGYVRVSSPDQNPERQLAGVVVDRVFMDMASAKSTLQRPQLQEMLRFVREDDVIVVHSMDRLARNVHDLKTLVKELNQRNVTIKFLKEGLEFKKDESPMAMFMLHVLGAFAEFEYAFIRERQLEGVAAAKKKGTYKGTVKKLNAEKIEILKNLLNTTRKSKTVIAADLGVSRYTLYRYLVELGLQECKQK